MCGRPVYILVLPQDEDLPSDDDDNDDINDEDGGNHARMLQNITGIPGESFQGYLTSTSFAK